MHVTRTRWSFYCLLLSSICTLLLISGCGYKLMGDQPTVLGERSKTLKIKGVNHPTLYPWMTHEVRSLLRDEINARHVAKWVDSGQADYEIQINVKSFTSREWMHDKYDQSVLYTTSITLEAIVYDSKTNREEWQSGLVSYSERVETVAGREAQKEVIQQAIRRVVDKLENSF